ncbi:AzlC family ABC transporter permease [Alkalicoccus daliensis]|uniref:4-azaleucine resistance probable transporter AzlC n=1 Tax=Alkalicoccus daliensis TaxID=745820 RepID=A0A1H0JZD2_9BACI|nr:AzlC family ABC transporter permease [Alkalicoccus daliensis]SDO49037.1 4-azaleucine resistance probable transporter AzlC [Alkalicoccus daliensis]
MDTTVHIEKDHSLRQGLTAGLSIAFGYMPVAITFGLLAGSTGLTVVEAVLMSMIVFAGAAQYMALSMIAVGAGAVEVILATFIVNFRHLLMSAAIQERAEPSSKRYRALFGFFLTDEVFAVSSVKEAPIKAPYILGVGLVAYSSWVGFTAAGYFTGAVLPPVLQESMGIALYALFIALLVPSIKEAGRPVLILALMGGGLHWIFQLQLATGWAIMAATITSVIIYELVEQRGERKS